MKYLNHFQRVVDLIEAQGHRCALVGGVAVSLRARERFTKDVDFIVAVATDSEAEALALAFQADGYKLAQVLEQTSKKVIATLRFLVPWDNSQDPGLDLIFGSTGIESEIVAAAEHVEVLPRLVLPVARRYHLIAMKVLAENDHRAQDRIDLKELILPATPQELELTREALELIHQRGFSRGKSLIKRLDKFIREAKRVRK